MDALSRLYIVLYKIAFYAIILYILKLRPPVPHPHSFECSKDTKGDLSFNVRVFRCGDNVEFINLDIFRVWGHRKNGIHST